MDANLSFAFKNLKIKKVEMKKEIDELDAQISHRMKLIARAKLTYKEIVALPRSTNVYNTVGRMFVLSTVDDVQSNFNKELDHVSTEINKFEHNKQILEFVIKDKADELRIMVKRRKEKLDVTLEESDTEIEQRQVEKKKI